MKLSSKAVARLAAGGFTAVLLVLVGVPIWGELAEEGSNSDARRALVLSDAYDRSSDAVAAEDFMVTEYLLKLGPEAKHLDSDELRRGHERAATELVAALADVREAGRASDRVLARQVLVEHRPYLSSVGRIFSAVDAGAGRKAINIEIHESDPRFSTIEERVEAAAASHRRDAVQALESVERSNDLVLTVTVVAILFGLALLAGLGWVVRGYRRRAEEARRAELERLEAARADLKRALDNVQRLSDDNESILNSAAEGIWALDAQGRVTFANPAAAELTGYPAGELIGADQHELVHHTRADGTRYPVSECPVHAALREGTERCVADEVYWRKDGTSFPVEYTVTPITEGDEVTGAVIVLRDVTERRAVDKMKDEFVSVVSHELRTPLTSIRGSLGLVAGGVLGPLPEKGQRMIDIALSNTDRLVRLINDILDIERIESGQVTMERRECEAGELMREAEQSVAGMAHEAEVALSLSPVEGRLWADPDRIVQVLTNLLSNAIKFSFAGATVRLSAERQGLELHFVVSDVGRGIPAERLESIFERFQQVDSSDSRDKGGTGLGLPICRSIVAQHGGRIWVESTPDRGSAFHVVLPALAPRPPGPTTRPGGAHSVLVCDDDDIVVEVVTELLERRGYCVTAARSGRQALELAAAERPDVILLDLLMPGISGWTTIAALKERPQTTDIPIVILSALTPQEREAPLPDVADWVDKPIDAATLLRALDNALTTPRGDAARVAIVEDDLDLVEVMSALFEGLRIEIFHAHTAATAVELIPRVQPDLVVLDLMLSDGDGFEVADALRRHDRLGALPLVVYTARDLNPSERERLRLGETEFLVKGRVSPRDFEQRVVGLLERITGASAAMPQELAGNGAALGDRADAPGR